MGFHSLPSCNDPLPSLGLPLFLPRLPLCGQPCFLLGLLFPLVCVFCQPCHRQLPRFLVITRRVAFGWFFLDWFRCSYKRFRI